MFMKLPGAYMFSSNGGLKNRIEAMISLWLVATLATPFSTAAQSDQATPPATEVSEEEEALLTLLQLMETDIATRTQTLDPDFSPGIVAVLRGEDLSARGTRTVGEALSLIPGVYIPTAAFSELPVVRGVGGRFTEGSGKVKVLLNGVSFNNNLAAGSRTLLRVPMALVDRIEFIRGPGASVYGEYAYSGVVNVITRSNNGAYLEGGSFGTAGAGALLSHQSDRLDLTLTVGTTQSDGDSTVSGPDLIGTVFMQPRLSNAPGPANNANESTTASLALEHGDFALKLQYLQGGFGDGFGVIDALPRPSTRIVAEDRYLMAEGTKEWEINPTINLRFKLGLQKYDNDFKEIEGLPRGVLGLPDGTFATSTYQEDRAYAGIELESTWFENQTWLLGVDYADIESSNAMVVNNLSPTPFDPGFNDRDREVTSFYAQDYIEVNDQWTFTIGVRADDYSDSGSSTNPRLAAVYRVNDKHSLKAQFAEAFRPPNFVELYNRTEILQGNPDILPETVQTSELAYIFKTSECRLGLTLFDSKLDDLVARELVFTPFGTLTLLNNSGGADVRGLELEFDRQLSPKWRVDANAAFLATEDRVSGDDLPGAADTLANLSWIYQPSDSFVITLQTQHIGDRHREAFDPRDDLDAQTVHHLTATFLNLAGKDLTLRVGARNLGDEDTFDPAPAFTYPGDYPREGSSFWLRLEKSFGTDQ